MIPHITQEKLKELLHYDPETGVFTWLVDMHWNAKAGDTAGTDSDGYRRIGIFGRTYLAHRLAWLYARGCIPRRVDHDDGNGLNNKFGNLRPCTVTQNNANSQKRSDNKSGFKGVSWYERGQKWMAKIQYNGKQKYLGYFETAELAHEFYCLAADMIHGEFSNHGKHKCAST